MACRHCRRYLVLTSVATGVSSQHRTSRAKVTDLHATPPQHFIPQRENPGCFVQSSPLSTIELKDITGNTSSDNYKRHEGNTFSEFHAHHKKKYRHKAVSWPRPQPQPSPSADAKPTPPSTSSAHPPPS